MKSKQLHIGAIIQARMQSTRLPGKIILPLPINSQVSLIEHIINSLLKTNSIDTCVLATTMNSSDNVLQSVAEKSNIEFYWSNDRMLSLVKKILNISAS